MKTLAITICLFLLTGICAFADSIAWESVESATGYQLYLANVGDTAPADNAAAFELIKAADPIPVAGLSYTATDLTAGNWYCAAVRAVADGQLLGWYSAIVCWLTPLPVPPMIVYDPQPTYPDVTP